jgi:hypothetical protein
VIDVDLIGAHRIARAVAPHLVRGGAAVLISLTGTALIFRWMEDRRHSGTAEA